MAISLSTMTNDTSAANTPTAFSPTGINWIADWRAEGTAKERILVNTTAATSYPETFRLTYNKVTNVYAGTNINAPLQVPVRQGFLFLSSLRTTYGLTDSADASYEAALPIVTTLTVKAPNHVLITDSVIFNHIKRMLGALYEQGSSAAISRVSNLMHGILSPKGIV